jgi:small-conductance mechanosensitive channel
MVKSDSKLLLCMPLRLVWEKKNIMLHQSALFAITIVLVILVLLVTHVGIEYKYSIIKMCQCATFNVQHMLSIYSVTVDTLRADRSRSPRIRSQKTHFSFLTTYLLFIIVTSSNSSNLKLKAICYKHSAKHMKLLGHCVRRSASRV